MAQKRKIDRSPLLQQDPELCQTVGLEPQFAKQAISQLLLNQVNSDALRREFTSPASDKSTSPEQDPDSARLSERHGSVSDGSRSNGSPQEHGEKIVSCLCLPLIPYFRIKLTVMTRTTDASKIALHSADSVNARLSKSRFSRQN